MDKISQNTTFFVVNQFNKAKTMKSHTMEILTVDNTYLKKSIRNWNSTNFMES